MQISERGIDLIRHHEGCRLKAYQDSAGVWTIGYGHTGPDVYAGKEITLERAEALLRDDLGWAERAVNELVEIDLSQPQCDALVSFVFNLGRQAFAESDLCAAVNRGEPTTVAMEFPRWRRAGGEPLLGLSRRRIAEAQRYLDGS